MASWSLIDIHSTMPFYTDNRLSPCVLIKFFYETETEIIADENNYKRAFLFLCSTLSWTRLLFQYVRKYARVDVESGSPLPFVSFKADTFCSIEMEHLEDRKRFCIFPHDLKQTARLYLPEIAHVTRRFPPELTKK